MSIIRLWLTVALVMAASPTIAKDVVGSGSVNGRAAQLYDDGSWDYMDKKAAEGCAFVDPRATLCDPKGIWKRSTRLDHGFDAIFDNAAIDDLSGALALQSYGSAVGNNFDGVITHFLRGAAATDGLDPDTIPISEITESTIGDMPARSFTIVFPQNGLKQVNTYTVAIAEDLSIYALTWAAGDTLTEQMKQAHTDFRNKIAVSLVADK